MDISKYKFVTHTSKEHGSKQVTALSSYAGRVVRGTAKCDPRDNYDMTVGMELAAARCNLKIAEKRMNRAKRKTDEANTMVTEALEYQRNMNEYLVNSRQKFYKAQKELNEILSEI